MSTQRDTGSSEPRLFLHADDFGMSTQINEGIVRGFTHGLLTSTSLLANAPGFDEACRLWRKLITMRSMPSTSARRLLDDTQGGFDLGVHLNLTQGRPLTGRLYPPQLLDRHGCFPGIFRLFRRLALHGQRFENAIYLELRAQIARLVSAGLQPTHVNGHQYVELIPVVGRLIPELCREFAISVVRLPRETALIHSTMLPHPRPASLAMACVKRTFAARFAQTVSRGDLHHADEFFGTAHAGLVRLGVVAKFLSASRGPTIEIALHPGQPTQPRGDEWFDPLAEQRPQELTLLESSELHDLLVRHDIRLGRLHNLQANERPPQLLKAA